MSQRFQINSIGPLLMVKSCTPLLQRSCSTPRITNVKSGVGSIALHLDSTSSVYQINCPQYRASKTALNIITACQAVQYGEQRFKVFAFDPGSMVSTLGPQSNAESGAKPRSEGAAPMVKSLNGERDTEQGEFLHPEVAPYTGDVRTVSATKLIFVRRVCLVKPCLLPNMFMGERGSDILCMFSSNFRVRTIFLIRLPSFPSQGEARSPYPCAILCQFSRMANLYHEKVSPRYLIMWDHTRIPCFIHV